MLVALALLVLAAAVVALRAGADEERVVVDEGAVAFNLRYAPGALDREDGELLTLVGRRPSGLFLQSFEARPLRLPAYSGSASGVLPLMADRLVQRERARVPDFRLVSEGRTRINEVPGYEVRFSGSREGRRLWTRVVMLVPDEPNARDGVALWLQATPASGTPNASSVGDVGALKLPLRSFRFGTEAP